jgi:hypothetical protein
MASLPNHFYATLYSNASMTLFPDNTLAAFTVKLAKPVDLGSTDKWEVGVCEISYHPHKTGTVSSYNFVGNTDVMIYCNLISQQFVGDNTARVLRTFIYPTLYGLHTFDEIYYVPVEKQIFQ